jgi:hypothetical protein
MLLVRSVKRPVLTLHRHSSWSSLPGWSLSSHTACRSYVDWQVVHPNREAAKPKVRAIRRGMTCDPEMSVSPWENEECYFQT